MDDVHENAQTIQNVGQFPKAAVQEMKSLNS